MSSPAREALGVLAGILRNELAGRQQIGFVGWTHPTKRVPNYYHAALMDVADALPPGQSLTGALKVFNGLLREDNSSLMARFIREAGSPFFFEGIYISWVLGGRPVIDGVPGELQGMPAIIHSKNGVPYVVGKKTMPLPPFLLHELQEYDTLLRGVFTSV